MYALWSKTELVPVFQSTGTLVPFGIPAESSRNVPPSFKEGTTGLLRGIGLLVGGEVADHRPVVVNAQESTSG